MWTIFLLVCHCLSIPFSFLPLYLSFSLLLFHFYHFSFSIFSRYTVYCTSTLLPLLFSLSFLSYISIFPPLSRYLFSHCLFISIFYYSPVFPLSFLPLSFLPLYLLYLTFLSISSHYLSFSIYCILPLFLPIPLSMLSLLYTCLYLL